MSKSKKIHMDKVKAFIHKRESLISGRVRELYYTSLTPPRLENVYRERGWKAALGMDLKVRGQDRKELWNWKP